MLTLPEYPWEALAPYRRTAQAHPGGLADLSIGTPVDPTPPFIQQALAEAADAHGYPTTHGTPALRQAIVDWYARRRGVPGLDPDGVIPTVGSKEFIAWLPLLLGLGPGDVVVRPSVAYPTYDIGAQLVGATPVAADSLEELDPQTRSRVKLIWTNSPGNPTGAVATVAQLRAIVEQGRAVGAVVAGDECYAELGWEDWDGPGSTPSILDPQVTGGETTGLLSVYSLSKQSNLAGYRAAFAAGDRDLVLNLVNSRKHAGMIVPAPVQAAMVAALGQDAHVQEQKDRYRRRRELLKSALQARGLVVEHSEAGLYLWVRDGRGPDGGAAGSGSGSGPSAGADPQASWDLVEEFAQLGILVGPGVFYGEQGNGFVRVALTAGDEAVEQAARRLRG